MHVCGNNDYNKLGFNRPGKITAFVSSHIRITRDLLYVTIIG